MLDIINGLPLHPLLVHVAVTLFPVAALATIVVAWKESLRTRYAWHVVVLDAVALVFVFLTAQAGEALQERLPRSEAIHTHAEQGEVMEPLAVLLVVLAVFVAVAVTKSAALSKLAAALVTIAAAAGVIWLVVVGDSGASAVWKDVIQNSIDNPPADRPDHGDDD